MMMYDNVKKKNNYYYIDMKSDFFFSFHTVCV